MLFNRASWVCACVCVCVCLCLCVCVCLCMLVCVYCLRAGTDDAILLHLWSTGTWIRAQAQCRCLIGQWQHGPAHCTFLHTVGAVWHLAESRTERKARVRAWTFRKGVGLRTKSVQHTCLYSPKSQGDLFQLSLVLWLSILRRFHLVLLNIVGYLIFLVWRLTNRILVIGKTRKKEVLLDTTGYSFCSRPCWMFSSVSSSNLTGPLKPTNMPSSQLLSACTSWSDMLHSTPVPHQSHFSGPLANLSLHLVELQA